MRTDDDYSDDSSLASNSSSVDSSSTKTKSPKGRHRRTPAPSKKKQRLQNHSDNGSPQPSTSHNGMDAENFDSESSETPDSDYIHLMDRSLKKKKKLQKKRRRPSKQTSDAKQKFQKDTKLSKKNPSTSSKKKKVQVEFDQSEVETLAQSCVYYLLIEEPKKYAIKKRAIVVHVFKDDEHPKKLYDKVLDKANSILKKIYGLEIMTLETQKDCYIIINLINKDPLFYEYIELSPLQQQQQGLILYLVTVIYMNGNSISENALTNCLKPFGIDLTSKDPHPVFGDVKKYITVELVKQMYLNYECISKEPLVYEFTCGLRTIQECSKRELLEFACEIMDTLPEQWPEQYKDAEK